MMKRFSLRNDDPRERRRETAVQNGRKSDQNNILERQLSRIQHNIACLYVLILQHKYFIKGDIYIVKDRISSKCAVKKLKYG
jgi:hypothetical protein